MTIEITTGSKQSSNTTSWIMQIFGIPTCDQKGVVYVSTYQFIQI